MSQEDVEVLRGVYARWARGDFWTPEVFDPAVEIVWAADVPDLGTMRGLAGLESSIRQWFAVLDEMRWEAEELVDLGERVLVLTRLHGRGKGSSLETEAAYGHVWTMREGKAIRLEGYVDWDAARRSVGLAP